MKEKIFLASLAVALIVLSPGCVSTVGGKMRPGVPLSKDRIESKYERSVTQILDAAREVLKFNGRLYADDIVNNTLEAKIDTRTVWVRAVEIEPNVTQVIVQARKPTGVGDVVLASEIDKQIALRLR